MNSDTAISGELIMLSASDRRQYIEHIRQLPGQLRKLVSELTDEQLYTHFLEGEWSVAQNVHHLVDSHINSYVRLKLMLTEDLPTFRPYYQEKWAELPDYQLPIEVSLRMLEALHERWVALFESLDYAQWQRPGYHPEVGQIRVDDLLKSYAEHGHDHLDQIQRTLAAQKDA
ncbi:MAG: putative metal-dependent hydrolase [Anaerolineae bacterium]|nr:putative metal-dependent hydrolase [Anaerolineae bacterium]